ncbi:PepSY-associated TM helix domain-containing protein [Laceyella putida]|uniref:PepSY-associated TM helix domain-containing protein n=1 Tax=Laceyella putida TaxID=110101 RepID=A0ABW2RH06_9BACL
MATSAQTVQDHPSNPKEEQGKVKQLYSAIWRWHFYAGIIFAPFIVMLSITGAIYLFKTQIENWMYQDFYYIQAGQQKVQPSAQLAEVKKAYPKGTITSYQPSFEANRTSQVGVQNSKQSFTVFVNPYDGKIVGQLNDEDRLMGKIEKLHGELMVGTVGDRLVELAACWAIILLITGIYLWWPRERKALYGILIPRLSKGKRLFWRDMHAVTAFWLSAFVALLIITGLPWSGLMGDMINRVATATHTGYPPFLWGAKPESTIPTKDVAKVAWAAEQLPVPSSSSGIQPISVEQVMKITEEKKVYPGYNINFPEGEKGVYTVSVYPDQPENQATIHIDQYSGKVLADLRFKDYGPLAKVISIGIALHEGHYFGFFNQILGLVTCLGLIAVAGSGLVMWWKRRPQGKLGAPSLPKNFKMMRWVAIIIIALGVLFPLVGVSLIIALLLDFLVVRKIPKVKQWVG